MKPLYFDNAATSWPKPKEVIKAMKKYASTIGASPGRSGHSLSAKAGEIVFNTRDLLSDLFKIGNPLQIIFTKNATESLNLCLKGLLKSGDHVITSSLEHNSMMRPLRYLEQQGLNLSLLPCSPQGELDPSQIKPLINKKTKAIFINHVSNVTGTIAPLEKIGKIAKENNLIFGVDAAQSAGVLPIDVEKMKIDLLAFTGHKSLLGPQGTGGLFLRKGLEKKILPLTRGGTGSKSEKEEQPNFMPDKYESGTLNTIGIAGLQAGLEFIQKIGLKQIRAKETLLTEKFLKGLRLIKKIKIYGVKNKAKRTAVVSFNLANLSASEVSFKLDEDYKILSRPGLHCAPTAHKTIGTFPQGTVRFSFGYFNTEKEIEIALEALEKITRT